MLPMETNHARETQARQEDHVRQEAHAQGLRSLRQVTAHEVIPAA